MKSSFFRIISFFAIGFFTLLCVFSLWIAYKPRDISYITHKVIAVFETLIPNAHLEIGSLASQYKGMSASFHVKIKGISLKSPIIDANIPELDLHYSLWHLLSREFMPNAIAVINPVIHLLPAAASTSVHEEPLKKIHSQMNINNFLAYYIRKPTNIPSIKAKNIDIVYFLKEEKRHFFIHNITMQESLLQKKQLDFVLSTYYLEQEGTINASLSFKDPHQTTFSFACIAFPMTLYSEVMKYYQKENTPMPYIEGVLHATGQGLFDREGFLKEGSFDVDQTHADLSFPSFSKDIYSLKDIKTTGRLSIKENKSYFLEMNKNHLTYNTRTITGDARIDFPSHDADGSVEASFLLDQLDVEDITHLWQSASVSKKWFTDNIKGGYFSDISFSLSAPFTYEKGVTIVPESISLSSKMSDMTVDYFSPFPLLKVNTGNVSVKNAEADFYVENGQLNTSSLQKSHFIFKKNIEENIYSVSLEGETTGDIQDILAFIPQKTSPYTSLEESGLLSAHGHVYTKFSLTIPFISDFSFEKLGLNFQARTQELSVPNIYKKNISLSKGNYTVNHTPIETTFSGNSALNEKEMHHDLTCTHGPTLTNIECKYKIDVPITHEGDIKPLKLSFLPKIEGPFGTHIEGFYSPLKQDHVFSFDLTPCKFAIPALRWIKPQEENTQVILKLSVENKTKALPHLFFSLDSKHIKTEGNADLTSDFSNLTSLHISQIKNTFFDLKIDYNNTTQKKSLHVLGKLLDTEGLDFDAIKNLADTSKGPSSGMLVHMDIDNVRVKNQEWEKFFLSFEKNQEKLNALLFHVRLPNYHFASCRFDKKQIEGQETPRASVECLSDDAGSIFSGLGISPNIGSGHLTLTAQENDKNIYEGQLEILSFALIKAPILGKVLSLISLTSILQQLNGKGIIFDRLLLPFSYAEDIINVHNGKISGPAVGFSFEGKIDTKKETFNCQGTVIPAQFLNNLFSHIPLLGPLLGGDGGLIAASYSLTGTFNNPHVFTNPLSILTPGLLRKVFDILPRRK